MDGGINMVDAAAVLAQSATAPTDMGIGELAQKALDAIMSGNWTLAAIFGVVAVVWALRSFGSRWIPWLGSSQGGVVLAFATAFVGAVSTAVVAGAPITVSLLVEAVLVGLAAMGLWSGGKNSGAPRGMKAIAGALGGK